VLEVSDIIDELNSVTRLLMVQRDTISQVISIIGLYDFQQAPGEILQRTLKSVERYTREIETMTNDAKRTYDSVST
jgi:hypothetical protein